MMLGLLVLYLAASLVTLVVYGVDKSLAGKQTRRIPESTLHSLALVGGWPGALIGQQLFRHKRRKSSFMALFWLTVLVNCGAVAGLVVFF